MNKSKDRIGTDAVIEEFNFTRYQLEQFVREGRLSKAIKRQGYLIAELKAIRAEYDKMLQDHVLITDIREQYGLARQDWYCIAKRKDFPKTVQIDGCGKAFLIKSEWQAWEAQHKELLVAKSQLREQINNPDPALVGLNETSSICRLDRETISRKSREGSFPKPAVAGSGTREMLFRRIDIQQWLFDRSTRAKANSNPAPSFTEDDYEAIFEAARLLQVTPDFFIKEAALYKATVVLESF